MLSFSKQSSFELIAMFHFKLTRASKRGRRLPKSRSRHGAAVVELAVCMPVMFIVIFGSIEACNMTFLKQRLTESAYEGALLGSRDRTTETELEQRVETVLTAWTITGASVTVDGHGTAFDLLEPGERFTVRVTAGVSPNTVGPRLFAPSTLQAEVVGHKQ